MFPSIPFPQAAGMRSGRRMLLDSPRIKALPRCLDSCFSHSASLTALCHDSDELLMPHFFFYCSGKREGEDGGWWGVEVEVGVRMEADGAPESPPPLHMPLIVSVRCGCCCIDVPLISAHSQTLLAFLRSLIAWSFVCRGAHAQCVQGVDGRDATLPIKQDGEEDVFCFMLGLLIYSRNVWLMWDSEPFEGSGSLEESADVQGICVNEACCAWMQRVSPKCSSPASSCSQKPK